MDARPDARPFLFGTNLKMHHTAGETVAFLDGLRSALGAVSPRAQLFVIPPFTSLPAAADHAGRGGFWLGAQNMHWEDSGPFTGEISAPMLTELGVDLVLIGHAERRAMFGESDESVNRKVRAALAHGLRAHVCVGELANERTVGAGVETVVRQLKIALSGVAACDAGRVIVAYEPVWSIGEHGTPAHPAEVRTVILAIRKTLEALFGSASAPSVVYGGSVDSGNCGDFARIDELDGLFVGRAAWSVAGFVSTLRSAERARFGC